jgi:hypothetical protein
MNFVNEVPNGKWVNAKFSVKRLLNDHHDIEWGNVTTVGKLNVKEGLVLVDSRDDAFDIEYYTRGGGLLQWEQA